MRFVLMLIPVALALPALAADLRDPTAPPHSTTVAGSTKATPKLTSILIASDRRVAVIDGVTLLEGSEREGIALLRVTATGAEVRKDGRIMQLALSETKMTKERR